MKLTKTILVAALVAGSLFASNGSLLAQTGGGATGTGGAGAGTGGRRAGAMTSDTMIARFQTALGETNKLTSAEIPQVKAVLDDMIKKQADLRADTTVTQADQRTKRAAIATAATDKLQAIVTPAQFTILKPLIQRGGGRRGGNNGGGTPPPAAAPPQT